MKTLTLLFAALLLSACNPTFDRPPLLQADGAVTGQAKQGIAAPRAPAQARAVG
ncbi:hypothetical protein SAMN04487939_11768 [Lysobacter sp. yr284]|uniref:hypothetical protein n=1 Tax=Lysobacter sp. yr284 TaxID=1761791 RepID=UPI000895FD5E|nr:hypothetical protein [Lysobacter sp. yr284]SDZ13370.1 hypothetical protein SAMN04487939_11768 [Lysobacter sp. yr284]